MTSASRNLQFGQDERRKEYPEIAEKIDAFCAKLGQCAEGEMAFTVELDDPSGNSYVESYESDPSRDQKLKVELYDRTTEQSEALGLKVENEPATSQQPQPEIAPDDPYHGKQRRQTTYSSLWIPGFLAWLLKDFGSLTTQARIPTA